MAVSPAPNRFGAPQDPGCRRARLRGWFAPGAPSGGDGTRRGGGRIVALAEQNGVVIESDPVLAEALSRVELDETIPIELYKAVAVVIAFVLRQAKS
ncbi:EscU/YscU/HrcU family type III secretion system export apparatus switch protein [Devosia geojensis]|uniref:EscU/YscU/HrcU family type III secretion system export apparatus switch protein n=1 Tax=Devosia geojensis TaxID=443610 RepID=UPI003F6DAC5B